MRIFYSDLLKKQISKRKDSARLAKSIKAEFDTIVQQETNSHQDLLGYLKSQNSKKLKGATKNTFKYRLSDGDRILYTYGRELEYLKDSYPGAMVILAYAIHDRQGREGKRHKYGNFSEEITHQDMIDWNLDSEKSIEEIYDANYTKMHRLYVYDNDNIPEYIFEDGDVLLSKEQANIVETYIRKPKPTLIRGGAGSGKTIIGIHILHDFAVANPEKKCIYFTQSRELLRKAKERFKYIVGKDGDAAISGGNVEFYELNEFCIEHSKPTRIKVGDIATFSDFKEFISSTGISMQDGPSVYDLWAEVRGTIKGGLDNKWSRSYPFNQCEFEEYKTVLPGLEKRGLIKRLDDNPQLFVIAENIEHTTFSSEKEKELFCELLERRNNVDCEKPLRDIGDYVALPEERTTLETHARKQLYSLAQDYQKWLYQKKLLDDNDLILEVLYNEKTRNKYDLVVVDEVQDYTELQLLFIRNLVKNIRGLVFAGDVHQIINPTIFDEGRLHSLLSESTLQEYNVSVNFRSAKQIVSCTNMLAKTRAKYIAKKSGELDEYSYIEGHVPITLDYSKDNIIRLLDELSDIPRVAVLVPDEETKNYLISIFGVEKYKEQNMDYIFTIPEIKGMEYRYVVCFNLVSAFREIWNKILIGKTKKRTKYRYYFNLLYVAFSRAQESLCIVESENVSELSCKIYGETRQVQKFDAVNLYIDQLPRNVEDLIAEAEDYFRYGDYERSKQRYIKAGREEFATEIDRCDIYQYIKERKYEKALRKAIQIDDVETIRRYIDQIPKNKNIYKLFEAYIDISKYTRQSSNAQKPISTLIEKEMGYLDNNAKEKLCERFIKRLDDRMLDLLEQGEREGIYKL